MNEEPSPAELLAWFEAASATLVEALAAADPSAPVWTFTPDHTVRFWFRRQAHEAAVHRYDAELAAGRTVLRRHRARCRRGRRVARHEHRSHADAHRPRRDHPSALHRHRQRAARGEWSITLGADGPTVEPVHAKGDVAARGTASDLDLFVWGRVDAETLEVFGDAELLDRFRSAGSR